MSAAPQRSTEADWWSGLMAALISLPQQIVAALSALSGLPRWLTLAQAVDMLPHGLKRATDAHPLRGAALLRKAGIVNVHYGREYVYSADMERLKGLFNEGDPREVIAVGQAGQAAGLVAMDDTDVDEALY